LGALLLLVLSIVMFWPRSQTEKAHAAITNLSASLSNSAEVPPTVPTTSIGGPRPASFGIASFVLNDTAPQTMTMTVTVSNIDCTGTQTPDPNDNLVAAHIHAPGAPGTNGPVVWGFFGTPFNETAPNDRLITNLPGVGCTITGKWDATEGNATTLPAQIPNITSGLAYINFHTTQFGGGEIRGQILPAATAPTPAPQPTTAPATPVGPTAIIPMIIPQNVQNQNAVAILGGIGNGTRNNTPVAARPVVVAPQIDQPVLRPPNTGDAGLARGASRVWRDAF
jgi:hypothetical protein